MERFPPIGMSPSVWGPFVWTTMHIVSLGYSATPSQEEKQAATQFYESLQIMIPCPICREHYGQFLKETPPAVQNRDTLIRWVFNVHNKVNVQLGKPERTFEQFIADMRALSAMSCYTIVPSSGLSATTAVILLAVLGVGGFAVYRAFR